MSKEFRVAAFEGGQLRVLASGGVNSREAVLALPLSRLLVRMVRVPPETDAVEYATPIIQALSPFPDDDLTVSCETVREDENGTVVIAAAFPDSASDDIGEVLDAAKINVVRIDALVFGLLRGLIPTFGAGDGRRLVLIDGVDGVGIVVLDGLEPTALRAITDVAELRREVMLSLLEAEDFGGPKRIDEIVVVKIDGNEERNRLQLEDSPLSSLAPMRTLAVGADAALVGVAERSAEMGAVNALPESWREVLEDSRFKAKLSKCLAVAGGIWVLAMGVLLGVPIAYGYMTDHQKELSKRHAKQYNAVKAMKEKVDVIHKYSDHARGALEIMKAVSDRLPEGVTLQSWNYKRADGISVRGEADTAEAVYTLKDSMDALAYGEDEDGERIFAEVELKGPNALKSKNLYTFDLNCLYHREDGD